ncbi:MAG TPA: 30S ribosome-binding factor RbfA [Dehalococcoidia bacterium]|nr:30S ribosome-binding factor RbfA [Dehalococcoidia bacterium]
MTRRVERLGELLRAEISDLLRREVKDPRVGDMVTISSVKVSPDLRQAKVMVSVYGTEAERTAAVAGLRAAHGFLRNHLGERLKVRRVPTLDFELDRSIEQGARVLRILAEITDAGAPSAAPGEESTPGPRTDESGPGGRPPDGS